MNIAFIYEHPTWSESLINCFQQKGLAISPVNVAELKFDSDCRSCSYDLAINRVNIMPSAERSPQVFFQTQHFLRWLELCHVRVINGSKSHAIGASKVNQNAVFSSLGLHYPAGISFYQPEAALEAANQIGYPVIVKPNIGGSGSGVVLFNDLQELEQAVRFKSLDLGVDRTGIVQRYIRSDGYVYRIEILGDDVLYTIRQEIQQGQFNYCAADGCSTVDRSEVMDSEDEQQNFRVLQGNNRIETFHPDHEIVENVARIISMCGADFGGVEYLMDTDNNEPCYYDFNPYSNFVSNAEELLGFSAEEKFVEFVQAISTTVNRP